MHVRLQRRRVARHGALLQRPAQHEAMHAHALDEQRVERGPRPRGVALLLLLRLLRRARPLTHPAHHGQQVDAALQAERADERLDLARGAHAHHILVPHVTARMGAPRTVDAELALELAEGAHELRATSSAHLLHGPHRVHVEQHVAHVAVRGEHGVGGGKGVRREPPSVQDAVLLLATRVGHHLHGRLAVGREGLLEDDFQHRCEPLSARGSQAGDDEAHRLLRGHARLGPVLDRQAQVSAEMPPLSQGLDVARTDYTGARC